MIFAILITIVQVLLLGACLIVSAGQMSWPMAWAVLGIYAASKAVAFLFVNPDLIKERVRPGPGVDPVDKILGTLGYLSLYPCIFLVAGLSLRFDLTIPIHPYIQLFALLIFIFGYSFAFWAVYCNPFFSTFVRIQNDRGHAVVTSGPYALVRHPGYAGVLLSHLALPVVLDSMWAFAPATVAIIFFVLRTTREDRTLRDHLAGYRAYQAKVPWRLVPRVW